MNLQYLLELQADILLDVLDSEERMDFFTTGVRDEFLYQDFLEEVIKDLEEEIVIAKIVQLCLTGK